MSFRATIELISSKNTPYRLETFRSIGAASATASQQLRCYFTSKCSFPPLPAVETNDIRAYSDPAFLSKASENTLQIYSQAARRYGPVLSHFQVEGTRQHRLVIAYDQNAAPLRNILPGAEVPSSFRKHPEATPYKRQGMHTAAGSSRNTSPAASAPGTLPPQRPLRSPIRLKTFASLLPTHRFYHHHTTKHVRPAVPLVSPIPPPRPSSITTPILRLVGLSGNVSVTNVRRRLSTCAIFLPFRPQPRSHPHPFAPPPPCGSAATDSHLPAQRRRSRIGFKRNPSDVIRRRAVEKERTREASMHTPERIIQRRGRATTLCFMLWNGGGGYGGVGGFDFCGLQNAPNERLLHRDVKPRRLIAFHISPSPPTFTDASSLSGRRADEHVFLPATTRHTTLAHLSTAPPQQLAASPRSTYRAPTTPTPPFAKPPPQYSSEFLALPLCDASRLGFW
ncbi:hypothetical protein R3P38DRAFT_3593037 [Favolaschia claudopus]|uniref:NAD-specific glutamate dehydrogenase second domain-containing protein n=1 Tax=Favolaschia claudopus TaxID=2862362 RepID=A0AAW0AFY7_9AGAR